MYKIKDVYQLPFSPNVSIKL